MQLDGTFEKWHRRILELSRQLDESTLREARWEAQFHENRMNLIRGKYESGQDGRKRPRGKNSGGSAGRGPHGGNAKPAKHHFKRQD